MRTKGSGASPLFDYVVTTSGGWTATATGNVATSSVYNKKVSISK